MSTGVKIAVVVVLVAAVAGAGYIGWQVAGVQTAAAASAQQAYSPMMYGFTGPMMGGYGPGNPGRRGLNQDDQGGRGTSRGPMMGGYGPGLQGRPCVDQYDQDGSGYFHGPMMGGGWMFEYREQMHAALAKALGITDAEFDQALAAGKTPWQMAQDKGLSADDFQQKMIDAMTEVLKQAVADGKLTQAQADAMIAHMQAGGFPGMMWGGWGNNAAPLSGTPQSAPTQ